MRSSAFQISVYYKEYNQNIKIFNTNKYSQENVIKNIYIYQHSRRVPDRLKPWPMKIRNQKISNQENSKRKILGRVSGETAIGGREKKLSHFKNSHIDFLTKKQKICNQKH